MKDTNSGSSAWPEMQQLGSEWRSTTSKMWYYLKKSTIDCCLGLSHTLTIICTAILSIVVLLAAMISFSVAASVTLLLGLLKGSNALGVALGVKVSKLFGIQK